MRPEVGLAKAAGLELGPRGGIKVRAFTPESHASWDLAQFLGGFGGSVGGSCSAVPLARHQQAGGQDCMHTGWLSAVLASCCTACSPRSVAAAASKYSCTNYFRRWMTACARATHTFGRWAMPWRCR